MKSSMTTALLLSNLCTDITMPIIYIFLSKFLLNFSSIPYLALKALGTNPVLYLSSHAVSCYNAGQELHFKQDAYLLF